ncbi:restriction endonuclease subunit S, partial [Nostoc linckia z16]
MADKKKIPEGWELKKLGEICDIKSGKNQSKVINPNGKYPIYGSSGIFGYADDYICDENTTIIGRKGTINTPL